MDRIYVFVILDISEGYENFTKFLIFAPNNHFQTFRKISGHDCLPEGVCLKPGIYGPFGPRADWFGYVDPCLKLGCHENAECIEIDSEGTEPEYDCECKTGFVGDGFTACDDVDECDPPLNPCGENGVCNNTLGSFNCGCEKGYKDIAGECVDIDECKEGGHVCDVNAYCYNVRGKKLDFSFLGLN